MLLMVAVTTLGETVSAKVCLLCAFLQFPISEKMKNLKLKVFLIFPFLCLFCLTP